METQSRLPEPPPPAQLTPIPIPDAVLRAVYASDQDMYPVALSYSRLRAWVDASPDLSICFQDSAAAVAGVIIVLPLQRRHWEDLLVGGLKEPDIEPESIVFLGDGSGGALGEKEEEVGLHVYHIERFDVIAAECGEGAERRRFSEYALAEVVKRVENRPAWKVVGMSALTATPAGKRTFERLGFTPTGYKELFVAQNQDEGFADATEKQQVEMVCIYPRSETEP